MPSYGNAGVSLLAGVLFGLITMLVQYVGLFMTGLHTGLLLGLASLLTADHFMETSPKGSVWLCVAVLLCTSLTFAIFNLYFRKVAAGRKKPRAPCTRGITRADRAEMRQKKYRYLYQVRTAHGDVISQMSGIFIHMHYGNKVTNILISLLAFKIGSLFFRILCNNCKKKDCPELGQGECSTLQSDATHLTILPDAQLAALTESEDDSQTEIGARR
ncbi:hypothetical protein NQ314_010887 [Rhamnusium bicolor]|uniref:Transmembrane protein 198 n=1 Tax=Rhamnusium bicolor TaxID=1586634 RepID=A0AAV8XMA2_9CUCU|nr:hypothetical protein NQ314_010887 [Rhamnusium bicolor]